MIRRPPRSPLFPSTPLSRSEAEYASRATAARRPHDDSGRASMRSRYPARESTVRAGGAAAITATALSAGDAGRAEKMPRSEEHTAELQSPCNLVCRLLLVKK